MGPKKRAVSDFAYNLEREWETEKFFYLDSL
jgi:hypothetical protein